MIDEERAEKAVEYLRDTAEQAGQLKGHLAYCDANLRRVKSLQMVTVHTTGTISEREAQAYASEDYRKAIEDLKAATEEYETCRALRDAADLTIRVWQSQNASARQGNV